MGVLNVTPDSFSDGGKFFELEKAIEHGVKMAAEGADVIDVGGESTRPGAEPVAADQGMLPLIAETKSAFIIMHMQGTPRTMQNRPQYEDVVSEVAIFFRQQYARAIECGVDPMAIAFDPGIGFGKTLEHNLELLAQLERLRADDRPLVVGVSRKSFLAKLIDSPEIEDRLAPAVALTALLRVRGADVFRVHDVKENVSALRVTEAILRRTE